MTISVRFSEEETDLIKKYASQNRLSVSDLIRSTMMERIEQEYDRKAYQQAMAAYKKNPVTHTLDEVEQKLGLR